MDELTWVYYRIFLSDPTDFSQFVTLLNEVVFPVVDELSPDIKHFHYFYYAGKYKDHFEGSGIVERLHGVQDDDHVGFIRLRFLVQTAEAQKRVDDRAGNLINLCKIVRGYELPRSPYGIEENLAERFGSTRVQLVLNLIEAASRLGLSFARGEEPINPHPEGQGGSHGLVHLVANPLRYQFGGYQVSINAILSSWGHTATTDGSML